MRKARNPIEVVQDRLKRLRDKTYSNVVPQLFGQKYFYVLAWTDLGKVAALGPYMSENDAARALTEFADGEVFSYDTKNLQRATRQMKAELLNRGEGPDESLRRMLHTKGLQRLEEKKHDC